jgi:hypothetical protein
LAEFLIDTGRRVAPDANRSLGRTSLRRSAPNPYRFQASP